MAAFDLPPIEEQTELDEAFALAVTTAILKAGAASDAVPPYVTMLNLARRYGRMEAMASLAAMGIKMEVLVTPPDNPPAGAPGPLVIDPTKVVECKIDKGNYVIAPQFAKPDVHVHKFEVADEVIVNSDHHEEYIAHMLVGEAAKFGKYLLQAGAIKWSAEESDLNMTTRYRLTIKVAK